MKWETLIGKIVGGFEERRLARSADPLRPEKRLKRLPVTSMAGFRA